MFNPHIDSTIGAAFSSTKIVAKDNITDSVEIWDTAGQERYKSLVPMYYREAVGAIIVYDVTISDSLIHAHEWINDVRQHGPSNINIYLIGNKYDLLTSHEILENKPLKYISGIPHYYASAKTGHNITELFLNIISDIPRQSISDDPILPTLLKSKKSCC